MRIELEKMKRGISVTERANRSSISGKEGIPIKEIEDLFALTRRAEIGELNQIKESGEIPAELYEKIKNNLPPFRRKEDRQKLRALL